MTYNSESNNKNMLRKLIKTGFFHIISSNVLNKILTFLSNLVVVRIISKIDYGVFTYADNIVSLVLLATGMGLVSATFQLASEAKGEEKEKIYNYGSSIGIKINIILTIIILVISQFFPLKFSSAREYLVLMSINPIILIIFEFQQIYLRSKMENKKFSFASTLNTALVVIGAIVGVSLATVNGMIIGRVCGYIITIIVICNKFNVPIKFKTNKYDIIHDQKIILFKIAIISLLNNGISQLLYLIDVFLLGVIIADETVIASYKVATVIPTAMTFIPSAVVMYIYPYFAAHKDDKSWCLINYRKLIKYFGGMNLIIAFLMFFLAKPIIILLYGAQYIDAVACFRILAINYFFSGTFRIISGNLLVTQRRLGFNLFVSILSGIVNILGNILLIPKFTSIGAAITTLLVVIVSSLISTSYYVYVLRK